MQRRVPRRSGHPPRTTRRGALARLWPALAALVALVALLGDAGHMALISHAVCAAHGEVTHGEEHASAGPSHDGRDHESGTAADAPNGEHEHCSGVATSGGALAEVPSPVLVRSLVTPEAIDPLARSRTTATQRLYRLAPKTSPPA